MNITKLTLAPLFRNAPKIEIKNPNIESATRLIKERMAYKSCYTQNVGRDIVRRKLPKELREFVNPDTWVPNIKDVSN